MHILFAASEATPYSKTGGLADVCSALPKALSLMGRKVSIVAPFYRQTREYFKRTGEPLETLYGVTIKARVGKKTKSAGVKKATLRDSNVDVYFIDHQDYFDRDGLYNSQGVDYSDNCERFSFFSRAVLELIPALGLDVDIVHANDWQTGLVPVFLDYAYKSRSRFEDPNSLFNRICPEVRHSFELNGDANPFDKIKSVMTIHNMRHQGRFWRGAMELTGLDWRLFTFDKMEFYGQLNLLKSGLVFCDAITTVSPQYAKEIQTESFGERLQGVLQQRSNNLVGILNGIDVDEWNPSVDPAIPAHYDVKTYREGKPICKAALQKETGLPVDPNVPLFGVVSRFDAQKGLDLIVDVADDLIERENIQLVVLGSGDKELARRFNELALRRPNNVKVCEIFSVDLSHRIEAGSDVFLMPSRYEPCGLNQMYSLHYGTLPLVRDVGGLHDSVVNATEENIANGTANGFRFFWGVPEDLKKAIEWAIHCYRNRKDVWNKMIETAMKEDLSWSKSAREYDALYCKLLNVNPKN